jgi:HMG (high mobility group) box
MSSNGLASREKSIRDVFTDHGLLQLPPETFFEPRTHHPEDVSPPSGSEDYAGAVATKSVSYKADERSGWKDAISDEDDVLRPPGDKPKRPLSAYNFFFQLERERIIESPPDQRDTVVEYTLDDVKRIAALQIEKAKVGKPKEKRSHRKTHGKISFGDLARTIANKWKKLDDSKKVVFEGSASEEKDRYRRELQEWNKKQKKWKEATAKMTHLQHHHRDHLFSPSIVTPTQHPRATLQPTDQHLMTTLMKQQKRLLEESGFVTGDSPSSLTPNSDTHRQIYEDDLVYRRRVSGDFYDRPSSYSERPPFGERAAFGERVPFGERAPFGERGPSPSSGDRSYNDYFSGDSRRSDILFRGSSSAVHDYGRLEDTYPSAGSRLPSYQNMWLQQRRMQLLEEQQQQDQQLQQQQQQLQHQQQQQQQRYSGYDFDSPLDRAADRGPSPTGTNTPLREDLDVSGYMSPHPYHQDELAGSGFSRSNNKHYAL